MDLKQNYYYDFTGEEIGNHSKIFWENNPERLGFLFLIQEKLTAVSSDTDIYGKAA